MSSRRSGATRDLPLILSHFKCRFFGLRPQNDTPESRKDRDPPPSGMLRDPAEKHAVRMTNKDTSAIASARDHYLALSSRVSGATRDLLLILGHFKCRFFPSGDAPRSGFALRMTHQSQERAGTALVCHPERSEGSGVKNLQAEILPLRGRDRPKNRPQDDITLQTLPTNCLFCTITFPEGKNRPPIPCSDHSNLDSLSRQGHFSSP